MPLHHTLLLPSSDRNPLTSESPLERFDNLSRNRTPGRRSIPQWLLRRPYFFRHRTSSGASLRKAHRITPIIKATITGFTPTLQPLRNPIVAC